MALFPLTIKLYHMWEENSVRFALRTSPNSVAQFYFEAPDFQTMLEDSLNGGYDDHGFFVLVKEHYVRFHKVGDAVTTHIRIELDKWQSMVEDYQQKVQNRQGEYFSCEIH